MAQVTLPYTLTAGTPENVNNLMSNLTALRDGVNTIDTAQLATDSVTAAKIKDGEVGTAELGANVVTDAKLATASLSGLVLVTTTTVSGASALTVDSAFSSTYAAYKLVFIGYGNDNLRFRLRTSGSDNTNANYQQFERTYNANNSTAANGVVATGASYWQVTNGGGGSGISSLYDFTLSDPNTSSTRTNFVMSSGQNVYGVSCQGQFTANTSFDGFKIYTSAASPSVTGTLRVYGLRN